MKITLDMSDKNEGTESPYWMILDPRQMMRPDYSTLASMITGPFFSRESAQAHLEARRYAFGNWAVVYCCSGYSSHEYKTAWREARAAQSSPGEEEDK